jgi:hypothetical protein
MDWHVCIAQKPYAKIQVSIKSDKNYGYFTKITGTSKKLGHFTKIRVLHKNYGNFTEITGTSQKLRVLHKN